VLYYVFAQQITSYQKSTGITVPLQKTAKKPFRQSMKL